MIKLYDNGVYLLNGTEILEDTGNVSLPVSKEEAAKNTIAYGILDSHNTSGNMERLQIKFDKLTSHDITFVGIIQTARASGLEKFPVPYVLTNCHNSLCAVGGTINEDDHMFVLLFTITLLSHIRVFQVKFCCMENKKSGRFFVSP